MPTYDYQCEACGHEFERWQEISARKLRTCPKCGKRRLIRLVGAGAGVIFKGSGFYETDYKRKAPPSSGSKSASPEKPKAADAKPSGSDATGGDTKKNGKAS